MSLWTDIRDAAETAGSLALNYYLPGSSLVTDQLVSQGSQAQLSSPIGQLAQLATGLGGAGVGSGITGIPASAGWSSLTGGIGSLFGGAAAPASSAASFAPAQAAVSEVQQAAAQDAAQTTAVPSPNVSSGPLSSYNAAQPWSNFNPAALTSPAATATTPTDVTAAVQSAAESQAAPTTAQTPAPIDNRSVPYTPNTPASTATDKSLLGQIANSMGISKMQLLLGGGAGLAALMYADSKRYGVPGQQPYTGPLSKFKYDPSKYNPSSSYLPMYQAAQGGIAALAAGGSTQLPDLGEYDTSNVVQPYSMSFTSPDKTQINELGLSVADMARLGIQQTNYPIDFGNQTATSHSKFVDLNAPALGGNFSGRVSSSSPNTYQGRLGYSTNIGPVDVNAGVQRSYDPNAGTRLNSESIGASVPIGKYGRASVYAHHPHGGGKPNTGAQVGFDIPFVHGGIAALAQGGASDLGSYSDGGRLLKGPGDGMSDNIPATIANSRPARLADGEFVVPADVVSHLGNGSTDAGAKHLYTMMDKVRRARTGTTKQGKQINPQKYLPA
jgi:hypothetical protein